jgi:hypothetical protein
MPAHRALSGRVAVLTKLLFVSSACAAHTWLAFDVSMDSPQAVFEKREPKVYSVIPIKNKFIDLNQYWPLQAGIL